MTRSTSATATPRITAAGIAMSRISNPYGDDYWTCPNCSMDQYFSDAETVEINRAMEAMNYPGIQYPIWWSVIK